MERHINSPYGKGASSGIRTSARIVPHDLAFGVGTDASQGEEGLRPCGKGLGMWVIDRHDDVVVADVVDDDFRTPHPRQYR
jgi:hypothetical protein